MTKGLSRPDIWQRLAALSFDVEGAALPFTSRLARDNGWSRAFAQRAAEEYKRFAYLAMVSAQPVTPSDEVDQVWHLHLCYTRHYWGPFKTALGAPLHHGPTRGGEAQGETFRTQYAATMALYRDEFGEAPPADLWPPSHIRFGKAPTARRVLTADYVLLPKRALRASGWALVSAMGVLFASAAFANDQDRSVLGFLRENLELIGFVVFFFFFVALLSFGPLKISARRRGRSGAAGGGAGGCGTKGDHGGSDAGGGDGGSGCGGCGGCGG